uniref:Uncharacterized protein n=1 Tax=Oryza rufipogon TaxID=4529 RepID=A0A0E0QT30_ORYRU
MATITTDSISSSTIIIRLRHRLPLPPCMPLPQASFLQRSSKEASAGAYDHLGELDQALFMYLDHGSHAASHQEQRLIIA